MPVESDRLRLRQHESPKLISDQSWGAWWRPTRHTNQNIYCNLKPSIAAPSSLNYRRLITKVNNGLVAHQTPHGEISCQSLKITNVQKKLLEKETATSADVAELQSRVWANPASLVRLVPLACANSHRPPPHDRCRRCDWLTGKETAELLGFRWGGAQRYRQTAGSVRLRAQTRPLARRLLLLVVLLLVFIIGVIHQPHQSGLRNTGRLRRAHTLLKRYKST